MATPLFNHQIIKELIPLEPSYLYGPGLFVEKHPITPLRKYIGLQWHFVSHRLRLDQRKYYIFSVGSDDMPFFLLLVRH